MHPKLGITNQILYRDIGNVTEGLLCDIGWALATSIRENHIKDEKMISFFPNPNYDENLFFTSNETITNCTTKIYNNLGVLLHQESLKSLHSMPINFPLEKKGLYFIKVTQGNEIISTEKLIKL
jgi:hypothetical protein